MAAVSRAKRLHILAAPQAPILSSCWEAVMAIGDDLADGALIDLEGTLYCAGYDEGAIWCEYSVDGGLTQATWIAGGTRRQICEADEGSCPALEGLSTGELVAAVNVDDVLRIWFSRDQGEHWEGLGTV